jgi:hypothetical protein
MYAWIIGGIEGLDHIAKLTVIGDVAVLPRNVHTVSLAADIAPAQTPVGHTTGHDQVAGGITAIDRPEFSIVLQQLLVIVEERFESSIRIEATVPQQPGHRTGGALGR